jgi:type IV pilus assembly protein PilE
MTVRKMSGFTLIEAMIVVAILGLIVAMGYPSYQEQVRKSRRAEGMGKLLELADRMERHYSDAGTYRHINSDGTKRDTTVADVFPGFTSDYYTLSINSQNDINFEVWSTPKGSQLKDKCGKFTLTSLGVKGVPDHPSMLDECWK